MILIKTSNYGKIAYDINSNFLFNEKFEIGASYRINSSVNILTSLLVTENLKIGYSYDYSLNNLSKFNSGSHEIILLYSFDLYNVNNKSPRFF
ncbi:MAG: type IX secretion system membrane protein PorP/SprF [Flavobacterium sp.]|nr:type IX secretion system membrane protein PorP/SprF [Flavobacterium sp.]